MAVENAETRRSNLGQLLFNMDCESRLIVRKVEKLNKKLVANSSGVLFNQVCIDEGLLPKYTNIYMYIHILVDDF